MLTIFYFVGVRTGAGNKCFLALLGFSASNRKDRESIPSASLLRFAGVFISFALRFRGWSPKEA
jgi:hypothetical protein